MKKVFITEVEYPDNDVIPSCEVIEVAQECIEQYMERYFGANIMDGDYDRIKVKEISDKTMIDKAYNWIISNMPKYVKAYQLEVFIINEDMANDFKRAMEE